MTTVLLKDGITQERYKAVIKEVPSPFIHGYSLTGRMYSECFRVTIYKSKLKIFWKKVKVSYRMVEHVELVADYVEEVFREYLNCAKSHREVLKAERLIKERIEQSKRQKYDSLPLKIEIR